MHDGSRNDQCTTNHDGRILCYDQLRHEEKRRVCSMNGHGKTSLLCSVSYDAEKPKRLINVSKDEEKEKSSPGKGLSQMPRQRQREPRGGRKPKITLPLGTCSLATRRPTVAQVEAAPIVELSTLLGPCASDQGGYQGSRKCFQMKNTSVNLWNRSIPQLPGRVVAHAAF